MKTYGRKDLPESAGVVILGGGLAGCAALLAAVEDGHDAILLEATRDIGGSTVLSSGLSAYAGTDEQAAEGIEDSLDLLRADILATGKGRCDPDLVDLYVANSVDTYRWLKGHGVRYGHVHAASGQTVPRSHPTDTSRMLELLLEAAEPLGGRVFLGVRAERLIREDGRVTGVRIEAARETVVRAGAVVIATGGFSMNRDLLDRFAPGMAKAFTAGGAGNQGDGLLMGWDLGAGVIDTPWIRGTYGIYPEDHVGEHGTGIHAIYKGGIAVNAEAQRFCDESLPYKVVGDHSLAQTDGITHQIFDARVLDAADDEVAIFDFRGRKALGMLKESDTLEGLADQLGIDGGVLAATVAEYNRRVTAGEPDEFGRQHQAGGAGELFPLVTPPFYAHPSGTVVLATYCGLTVDTDMQVLDVFEEPIEGVYAAGEVIGGFHGAGYMTGTSIGKSGIFGRIAGQRAGAYAAEHMALADSPGSANEVGA